MTLTHEQTTHHLLYGAGNRWATLVGINAYEDKVNYGNLSVCVQDARSIRQTLIIGGCEAGHIHLLTDNDTRLPVRGEIVA